MAKSAKKSPPKKSLETVYSSIAQDEKFVFFTLEKDLNKVFPNQDIFFVYERLTVLGYIKTVSLPGVKPQIYQCCKRWNNRTQLNPTM